MHLSIPANHYALQQCLLWKNCNSTFILLHVGGPKLSPFMGKTKTFYIIGGKKGGWERSEGGEKREEKEREGREREGREREGREREGREREGREREGREREGRERNLLCGSFPCPFNNTLAGGT